MNYRLTRPLILEGPDRGGKTTLGNRLLEEFGVPVHHAGGPPAGPEDAYRRLELLIGHPTDWIWDRTIAISERVYGGLRPGGPIIGSRILDGVLLRTGPILVYCRPPRSILFDGEIEPRAHKSELHVRAVTANRQRIAELYDRVISDVSARGLVRLVLYDRTTDPNARMLVDVLRDAGVFFSCAV